MADRTQLLADLDASTKELVDTLNSVDESQFNIKPDQGWSIGDIAEHLLLLETQVNHALKKTHPTERAHDMKVAPVRAGLRNPEQKFNAPEFIHPSPHPKNKKEIIVGLLEQRRILRELISQADITETSDYKHPVIGRMTRFEWTYFNIHHAERHMLQIRNRIQTGQPG